MTLRDDVWNEVLEVLRDEGEFQISDLQFDESQRHTVRRVLREMEDMEWLFRENNRVKTWRAGERAGEILDMGAPARVAAGLADDE